MRCTRSREAVRFQMESPPSRPGERCRYPTEIPETHCVNGRSNPYLPPTPTPEVPHRLFAIGRLLRELPFVRTLAFRRGDVSIIGGIAFYVDPKNKSLLFAASPSAAVTDERLELVVSEAIRNLDDLLLPHRGLRRFLRGRTLAVRLTGTYDDARTVVTRETRIDWATVARRIQDGG